MTQRRRFDFIPTSQAARDVGIHPNTLRWYESLDLMPPISRTPKGYRRYTPELIRHARIVYLGLRLTWMTGPIREGAIALMEAARDREYPRVREMADDILLRLTRERSLAVDALEVIARWASGSPRDPSRLAGLIRIKSAAELLEITPDRIRNWERNGLLILPRNPSNGYRVFGDEDIDRLKVVRLCQRAGYSLSAIRRLLQAADFAEDQTLDLPAIADRPSDDETAMFETFPTDIWLSTLDRSRRAVEMVIQELDNIESGNTTRPYPPGFPTLH